MKRLYIIYDSECGFCIRCRRWLEQQPKLIELSFVQRNSAEVGCRFPGIEQVTGSDDLLVVSDRGELYRGEHAFVMCLYALEKYRDWSLRLSHPRLLPYTRKAFGLLSKNRKEISSWMNSIGNTDLFEFLRSRSHFINRGWLLSLPPFPSL